MNIADFENKFMYAEKLGDLYQLTSDLYVGKIHAHIKIQILPEKIEALTEEQIQDYFAIQFQQQIFNWFKQYENIKL